MHENYDEELLLELVKTKQFRALRAHLDEMNEVDIAEFLDELEPDQQVVVFRLLPKDVAADVFTYLEDSEDQEKIINALSDKELREVLDELIWTTPWTSSRTCPPTWPPVSCATATLRPAARSTSCSTTPRTPPAPL